MTTQPMTEVQLVLTEEERQELLRVLRSSLEETHVERRRTDKPQYHAEVAHEEDILRNLLKKVTNAAS